MLSFAAPPIQIDDVILYPDHQDPLMFYYSAGKPRIARYSNDDLMYALFLYRDILEHSAFEGTTIPDEMGAGFLTLGVDCGRSEDELDDARDALADILNKEPEDIKLAPIPYKDGTVSLIGLDIKDSENITIPAVTDNRPQFVRNVMAASTPALLGDLRSIFSVSLSEKGAAFMAGVHGSGALPFGVSYDLTFEGLRPSIDVTITADTSQIRTYFGGGISGQYQFFKADISAGIEKMHRDGKVKIQITSQQTGAAAERSKKFALDLFKERIIQDLFNPGLPGVPPQAANIADNADALASASSALSQSESGGGSITLSLKAEQSTVTGELVYNFSESAPEERRDGPNAFLQTLLSKEDLDKTITMVDLGQSSSFFNNLEIVVSGPNSDVYETLRLSRITVDIFYGEVNDDELPEAKSIIFDVDSKRDQIVAFSRTGRSSLGYRYTVKYDFLDDDDISADALRYVIPSRAKQARTLSINPQDDFLFSRLRVRAGRIDENIASIDVTVTTATEDLSFETEKSFRFNPPFGDVVGHGLWNIRSLNKQLEPYNVKSEFVFGNGETHAPPIQEYAGSLLTIDDPFRATRNLLIIPNIVSEHIDAVDVEVEYKDDASGYQRRFQVSMQPPFTPRALSWPIFDSNFREIRYRSTVHENGLSETTEFELSDEPSITVGAALVLVDKVSVRLIGGSLVDAGIDAVVVDVRMVDAEGRERMSSLFFAEGIEMLQTLQLVRRPDEQPSFSYRIQTFKMDGSETLSDWTEKVGNPLLIISIRNL
ncbi:MAG: hypothetical protein COA45_12075 [Zetaproteobacteria bacterium]|nr:MAG: hypothetical protein COA45_12075 [Zetaproteobacteria bacterium]